MTREEAIKHIKDIICENNTVKHSDIVVFEGEKEALRMAIKALEQNESAEKWYKLFVEKLEQEPCGAISLDAVIEWLKEKDFIKMSWQEENARKELQEYFSVTPKPTECEDAISREAVICLIRNANSALKDVFITHSAGE